MTGTRHQLDLRVLHGSFAVCRLSAGEAVPAWAVGGSLTSITHTPEELSIVCEDARAPDGVACERGFAAIRVEGTLAPELVGVLESIAVPLADAGVPILAIGTYDTDYVLVRHSDLSRATNALTGAGHRLRAD